MGNKEKQNFVREEITKAFIELLKENELKDITNDAITLTAKVGRVSLYRNFESKEDILKQHIIYMLKQWQIAYDAAYGEQPLDMNHLFGCLFEHFKEHSDFYLLLQKRNLLFLVLDAFKIILNPYIYEENRDAYFFAFLTYGLYGWFELWLMRGMTESADSMIALLSTPDNRVGGGD